MPITQTLIVGAGPAGLAIAARLRKLKLPFEIIEASDRVARSWTKHYDRLLLHTVKSQSSLPYMPFPEDYPLYVKRQQLVDYLQNYAREFDINPHFNQHLLHAEKHGAQWKAVIADKEDWICDNLIIATGLNRKPHFPQWKGMDNFNGRIVHSRDYKNPEPFRGKKVLVVGMGNTGAEIALDLAENNVETTISVRSPLNIVPRDAFGRPSQLTALKFQKFPHWFQDALGRLVQKLTIGNLEKYGIQTAHMSPLEQLRKTGKTPLIDLGTVALIKNGVIKVKPDISALENHNVSFVDKTSVSFEAIILATGYRSEISSLVPGIDELLDKYGNPKSPIGTGKWEGLYFLGFDNFRPGGILGIINKDSEIIARQIQVFRTRLTEHFAK